MTVSTIFLQTTNEGENTYGDTTFSIHVPAKDKSYKLSVASFMFRPHIILLDETEHITFKLSIARDYPNDYNTQLTTFKYQHEVNVQCDVKGLIPFNPSKTDTTVMTAILAEGYEIAVPFEYESTTHPDNWYNGTLYYKLLNLTWEITKDNHLKLDYKQQALEEENRLSVAYDDPDELIYLRDSPEKLIFGINKIEIAEITPKLAYLMGWTSYSYNKSYDQITGDRCYNPQYWNYITLSCNKSYNTGNIVNQERFNSDIDESSQFYKGQILAYMPNNAYAPEAMQTGMATANEYIIQPADFNSIRFWLNYDNGEPVKLCSPMTIVLNMMPNQ